MNLKKPCRCARNLVSLQCRKMKIEQGASEVGIRDSGSGTPEVDAHTTLII